MINQKSPNETKIEIHEKKEIRNQKGRELKGTKREIKSGHQNVKNQKMRSQKSLDHRSQMIVKNRVMIEKRAHDAVNETRQEKVTVARIEKKKRKENVIEIRIEIVSKRF